jgi:hypothetical protein
MAWYLTGTTYGTVEVTIVLEVREFEVGVEVRIGKSERILEPLRGIEVAEIEVGVVRRVTGMSITMNEGIDS